MLTTVVMLMSVMAVGEVAMAEGNLSRRPVALPELELATQDGFGISQTEYQMETGKAYKLEIRSTGIEECAFRADEFFRNIWLRKVEAGGLEIKAAQLNELEFETEAEVEIFFVPIKPGRYPYGCKGLEDRGLSGLFIVR
ncbi:MAG: copper-binding protein [Acidiferrobacteraceae bacterium]|nr:copper-binding protein [Acidiferrobacteraceae bacterium]MBT5344954.1 copper-binding protein [Acidiferrobacteraceae bacterium]MBT5622196.1 copper-binding protein [Acidiferrobacteraceae bacterium]MBT5886909.1 copper-binding protein [Acidiferrobacteraceae bacterium]MBT5981247.1 copper-binding protein [Acidiferrobacteraceae bacterium]